MCVVRDRREASEVNSPLEEQDNVGEIPYALRTAETLDLIVDFL